MKVISAAIVLDGNLLLVKKYKLSGDSWTLPSAKAKQGKPDFDCLAKEMEEVLPGLKLLKDDTLYFSSFDGVTSLTKKRLKSKVYLVGASGVLTPNYEITPVNLTPTPEREKLDDITREVIANLRKKGKF